MSHLNSSVGSSVDISDDKSRLDVETIHGFLKRSYWAPTRTLETVIKSIENSLCFGAYDKTRQIAFARVVTDKCTFAYLCDVFVDEEYRSRGVSKALMRHILEHSDLQNYPRFLLATRDGHGLYQQFGFKEVEPHRFMGISRDGV
jgi:GNAT superfamily N-acetyltransferase